MLNYICHSENLIDKINQTANRWTAAKLDVKELKKIKRLLLTKHTSENFDILEHFRLSTQEMATGVRCPECGFLPMQLIRGKWFCLKCQSYLKMAHIPAIHDLFLLVKPFAANVELGDFLHIDSPRSTTRIIHTMEFN